MGVFFVVFFFLSFVVSVFSVNKRDFRSSGSFFSFVLTYSWQEPLLFFIVVVLFFFLQSIFDHPVSDPSFLKGIAILFCLAFASYLLSLPVNFFRFRRS